MDLEGVEITGDNPTRCHGQRKTCSISTSLLIGREFGSIGLPCFGGQIDLGTFLFDENFRGGNIRVNEIGTLLLRDGLDWDLELHDLGGVIHPKDTMQEIQPESLSLSFLISFSGPVLDERLNCLTLFGSRFHISFRFSAFTKIVIFRKE